MCVREVWLRAIFSQQEFEFVQYNKNDFNLTSEINFVGEQVYIFMSVARTLLLNEVKLDLSFAC